MNLKRTLSKLQDVILTGISAEIHRWYPGEGPGSFLFRFGPRMPFAVNPPVPVSKTATKALRALYQRKLISVGPEGWFLLSGEAVKVYGGLAPAQATPPKTVPMHRTRPKRRET